MPESQEAWQRLGEMLEGRRVALDPRYRNLVRFTAERGIDYRLAWDVEHAKRTNYRRPTLTAIEVAYGWRPGSIGLVLAGGQPDELDAGAAAPAAAPADDPLTPEERQILAAHRAAVLREVGEQRRDTGRNGRENSA
jgi:hypothetical protein